MVCFSPDSSKTLSELNGDAISKVLDCWIEQTKQMGETYPWVHIFENKGAMMGA